MSLRISGKRELQTPAGLGTRPTPSRVRQALFNILQGRIEGCRWLDLCCGAGTVGAEALCRGAAFVAGIEIAAPACRIIRANWAKVARPEQAFQVIQGDARKLLSRGLGLDPFDYVYFAPPYEAGLYTPLLPRIPPLLNPEQGILIVEHRTGHELPEQVGSLLRFDQRTYGQTTLAFYRELGEGL
ncbi:MAG: 16S rRNA (guanine(966)-N(2))-methyltransferase RsmD [Thermostichus sp. HHBFW_bins_43]